MRVLVTGARGMLGRDLCDILSGGHEVTGVDIEQGDITDAEVARRLMADARPQTVVHCAAYTDVDRSESEPDDAFRVNADGAGNVAAACRDAGCAIVYISTDYVFDGRAERPYKENDAPAPLGVYGASKLAGERLVREATPRHFVVRTSWLFGAGGRNFVDTIIGLAQDRETLEVVNDQVGSPTFTRHLSRGLARVIESDKFGTYHASNAGSCSWFDFAREILRAWGDSRTRVVPVDSARLGRPAKRPALSVLDTTLFRSTFGFPMPHWKDALAEYLELKRRSAH
ncbi:MAG: dTDP-4-dehydrorhamnose reductase [Candidatus Eisenbacteria bacterium]|nr:dTDP-4-dehydrorhamnose reductase [Candidatus Eisenbacteria bacterium]